MLKDLYSENHKTWMKEIKEDINQWKDTLCSWIEKNDAAKNLILPKTTFQFKLISIKISMAFKEK